LLIRAPQPQAAPRPAAGSLVRKATYLMMGFGAVLSIPLLLPSRALSWIELARGLCRDPDPGGAARLWRGSTTCSTAPKQLIAAEDAHLRRVLRLIHAAVTIAATEPLPAELCPGG
jgi:hypothetical protein